MAYFFCLLWVFLEKKQQLFVYTAFNMLVFTIEREFVYCAAKIEFVSTVQFN